MYRVAQSSHPLLMLPKGTHSSGPKTVYTPPNYTPMPNDQRINDAIVETKKAKDKLEAAHAATDPCPEPDPREANRAALEACHLPASGRGGGAPSGIAPAGSSTPSVFVPVTLPLKPEFEHISPEAPMRSLIPNPKCTRYRTFRRMAAQGPGRNAKRFRGLRQPNRPTFV
jgi:hypothetical protein